MTNLHRRRFLELGAAATAVSLGGCLGSSDEMPAYAEWIPATDGGVHVGYLDFSIATEAEGGNELLPLILPTNATGSPREVLSEVSGLDSVDDPLLTWPLEVGGKLIGGAALGIAVSGLGHLVDPEQPDRGIEELFMADTVAVGRGTIDLDEAAETLRSGSDGPIGEIPFEESGSVGEFTLYEPTDDETLDGVTAISETAVLVADTREEIQRVVETTQGERDREIEETETFEWLLETAGDGHVAGGWMGPIDLEDVYFGDPAERPVDDLLRADDDVLASVTFDPNEGEVTADLAVQRPLDDATASRLESQFGSESGDHSVSIEDEQVTASGTYSEDVLDFEFTQPDRGTTAAPDASEPVDPPKAVAKAVPDDAFEFTYEADQDRVKIGITEDLDVEEVTFEAVKADYEASTTTPRADMYMYVYVDTEGDTVVVTVTVDGTSGVVARKEFP
ncbi:Glycosyl hydrolases family 32 (levanase/invertase) [Halapricum desulfuricans]|uniref:Glycosyl hydrolases family 32 (Levanase/invertase) n=1 Tax=Halapricum desulfuricans TaxID=2841257 RepID=A0A897NGI3_9EURY|nr:hypothetical protein [Halapricum desulfuricans]QSG11698.1 Glycosyl hydrolases family 32 (levanase/invertase) [Halapricum desulfuricans]